MRMLSFHMHFYPVRPVEHLLAIFSLTYQYSSIVLGWESIISVIDITSVTLHVIDLVLEFGEAHAAVFKATFVIRLNTLVTHDLSQSPIVIFLHVLCEI